MPRIKDIAKKANVSVATVSYVLNNTRFVSPDKKNRVLQAIEEMNYVPNAVARGLRARQTKTIGLLVSDIANPFYPDIAKACEEVAHARGYNVIVMNTNDESNRTISAFSQIRDGKVDGLMITTILEQDREYIEKLSIQKSPCVLLYRYLEGMSMDTITVDNFEAAYHATIHLLKLGHKKIAFMSGIPGSWVTKTRLDGFLFAMKQSNLPVQQEWIQCGYARYTQSYEATRYLMNMPVENRPTAILNISDIGALGVIDAAHDLGIQVPRELAVIGFDDLFISSTRSVQLTTVHIPRYELGIKATELLLDRLSGKAHDSTQKIVLPTKLIVRKTCGAYLQTHHESTGHVR